LSYDRLPSYLLGITCFRLSNAYNAAVLAAFGDRRLAALHGPEVVSGKPELDLVFAQTGNSINLKFSESWHPTFEAVEGDLVIGLPRQTVIPLLVVAALDVVLERNGVRPKAE
jgi:hypothetical protein